MESGHSKKKPQTIHCRHQLKHEKSKTTFVIKHFDHQKPKFKKKRLYNTLLQINVDQMLFSPMILRGKNTHQFFIYLFTNLNASNSTNVKTRSKKKKEDFFLNRNDEIIVISKAH